MYERETASQRCPACYRSFTVLADEYGSHPCPYCGFEPWEPDDDDVIEDEDDCECPGCTCQAEEDEEEGD